MAQIKKTRFPLQLDNIPILIDDVGIESDYFKLKNFPKILHAGKNYFLIGGSNLLRPDSQVLIEITDSAGGSIYYEIPDVLVAGTFRIVSIFIYSDTPIGDATVTIVGEAIKLKQNSLTVDEHTLNTLQQQLNTWKNSKPIQTVGISPTKFEQHSDIRQSHINKLQETLDILTNKSVQDETLLEVPPEWTGKFNVRWTQRVTVDTLKGDDVPAVLKKSPKLFVSEIYDESSSLDVTLTPKTFSLGYNSGAMGTAFGNKQNNAAYYVKLFSGSFTKDMEGGIMIFPAPCSSLSTPLPFNTQITRVVNSTLAQVSPSYVFTKAIANSTNIQPKIFQPIEFTQPSSFILQYVSQSQNTGSINKRISYLNVKVTDLDTYAGVLKYIDIFKQPGNIFVGRYPIQPNEKICRGNYFRDANDFKDNWTIHGLDGLNKWNVQMTTDISASGIFTYAPLNTDWSASVSASGVLYSGSYNDVGQNSPYTNSLTLYQSASVDFFGIGFSNYVGKLAKFTTYIDVISEFNWSGTASVDDGLSFYLDGAQIHSITASGLMPYNITFVEGLHVIELYMQNSALSFAGNNFFVAFSQSLSTNSNLFFMNSSSISTIAHNSLKLLDAVVIDAPGFGFNSFETIGEDEIIL